MAKISYNANGLRKLSLREAVRVVSEAGYDGIELSLSPHHIDVFSMTTAEAGELRSFICDCGISACCLATGYDLLLSSERFEPSLICPTKSDRQRRLDVLVRSIDLACSLGIPVINFGSGFRKPEVAPMAARDYLLEGVGGCLEHVGQAVTLAIEPEPGFFIETNGQAEELIRQVDSPFFRLNQDIGHVNVCEDDYLTSIAEALPVTAHIHIEDIRDRIHRHEIPGDGDIDFPAVAAVLQEGGYERFVSVELYNHSETYDIALSRSLDHLRAVGISNVQVV